MSLQQIGFIALRLLGFAFFILLAVRIGVEFKSCRSDELDILKKRLAEGDLTEEQFRRMRDVLGS
jgi:uncharacterized membrane protein